MAKVTSFEELSDVNQLDGEDIFYVVDYDSSYTKNPVSKKIKYSTLLKDMGLSIGFDGFTNICVDTNTQQLIIDYMKKSGEPASVSVSLSSLVNIYDTDKEYLYIGNKNTISLSVENVAKKIGEDGINFSYVSDSQVSARNSVYDVSGNGLVLSDNGNDSYTLSLDYSQICSEIDISSYSKNGHGHEISDVNELEYKFSDIEDEFKTVNEELEKKALSVHTHVKNEITDFGSYISSSNSFLSSNSLVGLSDNWETAYGRTSADVGSIGYKNSLSTSDIQGYKDTTYSASGKGLKLEGTTFSISDVYVETEDIDGKLALSSFDDIKGNFLTSSNKYLSIDALDTISDDWTYENAKTKLSADGYLISDYTKLALSSLSDIVGQNIIVSDGKLSASQGRIYKEGTGIKIYDDDNKICVDLSALVFQDQHLSVIENKISVVIQDIESGSSVWMRQWD